MARPRVVRPATLEGIAGLEALACGILQGGASQQVFDILRRAIVDNRLALGAEPVTVELLSRHIHQIHVYELNRHELLRDVFVWAYERSCQHHVAVRQQLVPTGRATFALPARAVGRGGGHRAR